MTPKTFLDNLKHFHLLLATKRTEALGQLTRLQNGIKKLKSTNSQIGEL